MVQLSFRQADAAVPYQGESVGIGFVLAQHDLESIEVYMHGVWLCVLAEVDVGINFNVYRFCF